MKENKIHVIPHKGERWRGQPKLYSVHKNRIAAHRKARLQVARPGVIDAEPTMGRGAPSVKSLGKRNGVTGRVGLQKHTGTTCAVDIWIRAESSLESQPRVPRQHVLMFAESLSLIHISEPTRQAEIS